MLQGDRIRQARVRRALTQRDLGALIGQDNRYVSKVEVGRVTSITTTSLVRLATALQVSTDYLLGLVDRPTYPRRRETSTPEKRQHRQTVARHQHGSATSSARPSVPALPNQTTQTVTVNGAAAVAMCPHCYTPMQPLADRPGLVCVGCRYVREQA